MDDIATLLFDILVVYQGADKGEFAERIHKREVNQHFLDQQLPYFLKLLEIGIYMLVYKDCDVSDNVSWIGKFMRERKKRIENDIPISNLILRRSFVQSKFIRKLGQIPPASHSYNQQ